MTRLYKLQLRYFLKEFMCYINCFKLNKLFDNYNDTISMTSIQYEYNNIFFVYAMRHNIIRESI